MADAAVVTTVEAGVARITLNRPERLNALDEEMGHALVESLVALERDATVKAVLLAGAGRSFMAGGDLTLFQRAGKDAPIAASRLIALFHQAIRSLRRLKPPVIAAVHGSVAGGGLGLAMACDLVIASADARFVPAYTCIGTSPDGGTTWSITRLLGPRRAMEWLLLGDPLGAEAAERLGLVNRVVAPDRLQAEADTLAQRIASGPAHAFASVKRLVHQAAQGPFDLQLEAEREGFFGAAGTADFREGITAFFERRDPRFGRSE